MNEFGNLEYKDFLKRYGTGPDHDRPGSVPPTPLRRPATSGSDMYRVRKLILIILIMTIIILKTFGPSMIYF